MNVTLVSIGSNPSLALRNISVYARSTVPAISEQVRFSLLEYDLHEYSDTAVLRNRTCAFATGFDRALSEIISSHPRLVAFSCYLWNIDHVLELCAALRQLDPEIRVVCGGPNAGPMGPELAMRPDIDYVVSGDGEIPFARLLLALMHENEDGLGAVPGLYVATDAGVAWGGAQTEPPDLDVLDPVYDDYPPHAVCSSFSGKHVQYETQRGCPFKCSYCDYGRRALLVRDPEQAARGMLALLVQGYHVELVDPCFAFDKARAKQILSILAGHKYQGTLFVETRAETIDREMAELMAQCRIDPLALGLQTLSKSGQKAAGRITDLAAFERGVSLLTECRVPFTVDIIYGLPETTVDDHLSGLDYLVGLGVQNVLSYRLLGLPGTMVLKDASRHGMVFNQSPPYELLRSDDYSLEDLAFCGELSGSGFLASLMQGDALDPVRQLAALAGSTFKLLAAVRSQYDFHEPAPFTSAVRDALLTL